MGKKKEVDDRFKKFGTVSFTGISKVNDFISHLESGQVMGTRCESCKENFFPPRADCHQCFGSDLQWFPIEGEGTLRTFTRLKFAPMGFDQDLPYCLAVVDYGEFKIFGRVSADTPAEKLTVGMAMTTRVNNLPNGQVNYVFEAA